MSRILTLQRQARELGRLRTGTYDGRRPVRSDTWVITSHSEDYIRAAADEWGGTPEKWQPQGNGAGQWRVVTASAAIDAILPPGDPLSQAFEMWNRGGCARRCDGITESLTDSPCVCRADFGDNFHEQKAGTVCNMTTRLNVMLPAMPDVGVWRAETHSYYAANELAGHVDMIRGLVGPGAMVPVRLRIEQRTRVAGGQTKHFPVIALELRGVTAGQVLAGGAGLTQLAAPGSAPAAPAAIEAPPAVDYIAQARQCGTVEGVRAVWRKAAAEKALTNDMAAELQRIVESFTAQQPAIPEAPPADADDLWMQIVGRTPDGWTTAQLENDLTEFTGGVAPADATAADLAAYLEALKAGAR